MDSLKRKIIYGLIGLCSYIGNDLKASDQKIDFSDLISGEVLGGALVEDSKLCKMYFLYFRDSEGNLNYQVFNGDPEYLDDLVRDTPNGTHVIIYPGNRRIKFNGQIWKVTDPDSVVIQK